MTMITLSGKIVRKRIKKIKTISLTLRMTREIKEALKEISELERRSMPNMIEILIRDYCKINNIEIKDEQGIINE